MKWAYWDPGIRANYSMPHLLWRIVATNLIWSKNQLRKKKNIFVIKWKMNRCIGETNLNVLPFVNMKKATSERSNWICVTTLPNLVVNFTWNVCKMMKSKWKKVHCLIIFIRIQVIIFEIENLQGFRIQINFILYPLSALFSP